MCQVFNQISTHFLEKILDLCFPKLFVKMLNQNLRHFIPNLCTSFVPSNMVIFIGEKAVSQHVDKEVWERSAFLEEYASMPHCNWFINQISLVDEAVD